MGDILGVIQQINGIIEPVANILIIVIVRSIWKLELRMQRVETVQELRREARKKAA